MTAEQKRIRLREMLAATNPIPSFSAQDAFTALALEQAGVPLLFLGGFGASASLYGLPDLGFLTLTDMADHARRIAARVDVPLIVDGDTGFGHLQNVVRTVELIEAVGAAGVILEDQEEPKRCGHFAGKRVIAADEMAAKIRIAVSARRDPNFLIVARTDARANLGIDDAIERANRFADAGAELAFIEAPQSVEELATVPQRVHVPCMANMLIGGVTPILTVGELGTMGYKIVVSPIETLAASMAAVQRVARQFLDDGKVDPAELATFDEIKDLLGVNEWLNRVKQ